MLFVNLTSDELLIEDLGFTLNPNESRSIAISLQEVLMSTSVNQLIDEGKLKVEIDENYQNDFLMALSLPNMEATLNNPITLSNPYFSLIPLEELRSNTNLFNLIDGKINITKGNYLIFVQGEALMNSTNFAGFRIRDDNENILNQFNLSFHKRNANSFNFCFLLKDDIHFEVNDSVTLSIEGKTPSEKISLTINKLSIIAIALGGYPNFITLLRNVSETEPFNLKLYDNGLLFQENVSGLDFGEYLRLTQGGNGITRIYFDPLGIRTIDYAEITFKTYTDNKTFDLKFDKFTYISNPQQLSIDEDKLYFNEDGTYELDLNLSMMPVTSIHRSHIIFFPFTLLISIVLKHNGIPIRTINSSMIQIVRQFLIKVNRGDFISFSIKSNEKIPSLIDNRLIIKRLGT